MASRIFDIYIAIVISSGLAVSANQFLRDSAI